MDMSSNAEQIHDNPDHEALFRLAEAQAGFFTTEQAAGAGFSRALLTHHTGSEGRFERVRPGLYRLRLFPTSPLDQFFAAWLGVDPKSAVISHDSALEVYELATVMPSKIHVTVPREKRWKRPPPDVDLHTTSRLDPQDVQRWRGLPVTSVERTVADVISSSLSTEEVTSAVAGALSRGLTTQRRLLEDAQRRSREVLDGVVRALREAR